MLINWSLSKFFNRISLLTVKEPIVAEKLVDAELDGARIDKTDGLCAATEPYPWERHFWLGRREGRN